MGKLHVNLLGTSFTIQADDDEQQLQKLLGYYERIVNEVSQISSVKTPLQISILSGIMLCDELYKEKSNSALLQKGIQPGTAAISDEDSDEMERRTISMIDKISRVL